MEPSEDNYNMLDTDIFDQYSSDIKPADSTSPIHGGSSNQDSTERLDLKSTLQRQQSQIELLTRELRRTQARVRDLDSQLQQITAVLRRQD